MTVKHVIIILIFGLIFYSTLVEPNIITIKRLKLNSNDMPKMRIVFVSDFHLSKFAKNRFYRIIKKINEQNPDIVISGGDYYIMHGAKHSMDSFDIAKGMAGIKSKYGVYSVLGNHDYYKDGNIIKNALIQSGIKVLENSNDMIKINNKKVYIAGITDMQTTHYDLNKALKGATKPIILASHSPDITPYAMYSVNLILAGHTHGGQVRIPFFGAVIVPSKFGKVYESGFVDKIVYITKGLGTSIIRIRFNCMPEITVIDYN